jgi:hypothetical protein
MRAKRPFPLEKPRTHASLGVHAPDPLRDDPSHPHSSLGPDHLKVGFADGGVIGQVVTDSSEATGGFKKGGKIVKKGGGKHKKSARQRKIDKALADAGA